MHLTTDGWFCYYKGLVYANTPTSIHHRINNKALIANSKSLRDGVEDKLTING